MTAALGSLTGLAAFPDGELFVDVPVGLSTNRYGLPYQLVEAPPGDGAEEYYDFSELAIQYLSNVSDLEAFFGVSEPVKYQSLSTI